MGFRNRVVMRVAHQMKSQRRMSMSRALENSNREVKRVGVEQASKNYWRGVYK